MTAPETLEELRAALQRLAAKHQVEADDPINSPGKRSHHRSYAASLAALLPLAPEPIKVGDRVRCTRHDQEGEVRHIEETENGPLYLLRDPHCPSDLWLTADIERVDSSPSPGPEPETTCACLEWPCEHDPANQCDKQETVEPHESEDPEELAAAVAAGLLVEWRSGEFDARTWVECRGRSDAATFKLNIEGTKDGRFNRYRIHGSVPGYEAGS